MTSPSAWEELGPVMTVSLAGPKLTEEADVRPACLAVREAGCGNHGGVGAESIRDSQGDSGGGGGGCVGPLEGAGAVARAAAVEATVAKLVDVAWWYGRSLPPL